LDTAPSKQAPTQGRAYGGQVRALEGLDRKFRFNLVAPIGQVIATSEAYESKASAGRAGPGPLLGSRQALPGHQEALQETSDEADQDGEGGLTGALHPTPADLGRRPTRHARPGSSTG
jgi:Domain of unknown function (DUF1508)